LLVVESIVSIAWSPSADWMPGTLLNIVASGGSPVGLEGALSYSDALVRVSAFLAVAAIGTGITFRRRDVAS
jgi:hypothetical protein